LPADVQSDQIIFQQRLAMDKKNFSFYVLLILVVPLYLYLADAAHYDYAG